MVRGYFCLVALILFFSSLPADAKSHILPYYLLGAGGDTSNAGYKLSHTIGEPLIVESDSGDYKTGFWHIVERFAYDSDSDGDGLPDYWEILNLGNLDLGAFDDPDGDQLTNIDEFFLQTDPKDGVTDIDGDGLSDQWELDNFGGIDQGPDDDPDADQLTNLEESQFGTNPKDGPNIQHNVLGTGGETSNGDYIIRQTLGEPLIRDSRSVVNIHTDGFWYIVKTVGYLVDSDGDGMADDWENTHFGHLNQVPDDDPDKDQLSNLEEYLLGFDPNDGISDTDDDGLVDRWEIDNFGGLNPGPGDDPDGDQLTNLEEQRLGTAPNDGVSDTDGDSFPDRWELDHFGDLSQDKADDSDGDGIANYIEYEFETDPSDIGDRPASGTYYEYDAMGRIKRIIRIPSP